MKRVLVSSLRAAETLVRSLGGMPWKVERFNRLIERDVAAAAAVAANADVIVGIPFYRESDNISQLISKTSRELESDGHRGLILVVAERRARHLIASVTLPASTEQVKINLLLKPFGFGQKPGLGRRSWSHWAILRVAARVKADVVFIDADVRNSDGWVSQYLDAIQNRRAAIAVANYVRAFARDDAIVHVWDSLIFGALFKRWIAFRHGGDYAVSRTLVPEILKDPSIMRERTYTMDSAVIAKADRLGLKIEAVWLGSKVHTPIEHGNLFLRLPALVQSVFEDVDLHLPLLVAARRRTAPMEWHEPVQSSEPMRNLIDDRFLADLHADTLRRFHAQSLEIRRVAGSNAYARCIRNAGLRFDQARLSPRHWARLTVRCLTRYVRRWDAREKQQVANAYVPILELGALGFLNLTRELKYDQAFATLQDEYLPEFERSWNRAARQIELSRISRAKTWAGRMGLGLAQSVRPGIAGKRSK